MRLDEARGHEEQAAYRCPLAGQVPGDRHPQQFRGVRQGVWLPARHAHESREEVPGLVIR